eukprot:g318.t1
MTSIGPPPALKRVVSGGTSSTIPQVGLVRQTSGPRPQQAEWRTFMSIEERQSVRSKIRDAYARSCTTFDELLDMAVAIEEELVHASAPSRLDYFKMGLEYDNRLKNKRKQLEGSVQWVAAAEREGGGGAEGSEAAEGVSLNAAKKARK